MKVLAVSLLLVGLVAGRQLPWDQEPAPRSGGTTCSCGWTNRGRIVGGSETQRNEFPLMVSLELQGSPDCGASIITQWHVLTAAHCTYGISPREMVVNVGAHDLSSRSEGRYQVARVINHEGYDDRGVANDIALLVTATQIRFSQNVGPVCLPNRRLNLPAGHVLKALGWGRTRNNGPTSNRLLEVDLRVIDANRCRQSWTNMRPETNICTFENRRDTCQGDSGGPLIYLDPAVNRYVQAALVSYGGECAGHLPAVNTDVSAYLDWINRNVASSKPGVSTCRRQ